MADCEDKITQAELYSSAQKDTKLQTMTEENRNLSEQVRQLEDEIKGLRQQLLQIKLSRTRKDAAQDSIAPVASAEARGENPGLENFLELWHMTWWAHALGMWLRGPGILLPLWAFAQWEASDEDAEDEEEEEEETQAANNEEPIAAASSSPRRPRATAKEFLSPRDKALLGKGYFSHGTATRLSFQDRKRTGPAGDARQGCTKRIARELLTRYASSTVHVGNVLREMSAPCDIRPKKMRLLGEPKRVKRHFAFPWCRLAWLRVLSKRCQNQSKPSERIAASQRQSRLSDLSLLLCSPLSWYSSLHFERRAHGAFSASLGEPSIS
ncbi:unnamed protein product, partial [Symbiodinium sp. KB8]